MVIQIQAGSQLQAESKCFSDVVKYIDEKRMQMCQSVQLFETLRDSSLSKRQRLMFVPYMLFFTLGSPDLKTLMMRIDRPESELDLLQRKINTFIQEDNFHYNYYLRDLERLGFDIACFGSADGVIRHMFAEEGIPTRRVVYAMASYIHPDMDPLIGLAIPEIIEAALFDLFTTVYTHIVKVEEDESLEHLEYFGDAHVGLEQKHTVTSWFVPGHPRDDHVADIVVPPATFETIMRIVDDMMSRFGAMYVNFDEIIHRNQEIVPDKFAVAGSPHIDEITGGRHRG